jgi:hypothetical protein
MQVIDHPELGHEGRGKAWEMVERTLEAMIRGGIHDQLGGGFHRYSVDRRWHIPHYEKMLYDQAQIADACLDAWQISGKSLFKEAAEGIFRYLIGTMQDSGGAFHSAEDADSLPNESSAAKREGAFWTWTAEENRHGNLLGTLELIDTVKTKLVGNNKYITYTKYGVDGLDSLAWYFNWIAPAAGTGDVVFYGGFNSNQDGHKGGDITHLSTLRVKEMGTASISNLTNNLNQVIVYPNPVTDFFNIHFELYKLSTVKIEILDLSGKQMGVILNENLKGFVSKQMKSLDKDLQTKIKIFTLPSEVNE